ncbi:MAG: hypothetical protein A2Z91_09450 [Deltaproteobacteria bacterium GWA2_38_16]|nr:MAG: hypothetical protein A2Z91_09450 [Deltaproteobacteria bacterium GWA2_38_16]OGQ02480.1 MAG: hypothetical protein A3D19_09280 [Deltaproteobacteria bacterium RIFCSPHIGHO2_02_FULL_38_15]OGQ33228.1 MAG: hypothetical protein A3A72_04715 [Deltaproteobacteria bacterium RIFCSPLOWO2_01_FULL_38_9]OGQ61880.1 MAG: hypothetical protein A3G92_05285 [Deltaproteobacteria bacterium RIFCSPLOWO2_12_FULL_38_8]HBQ21065.1 phosphohydrolase [Deltaproteobacteria bacterium]
MTVHSLKERHLEQTLVWLFQSYMSLEKRFQGLFSEAIRAIVSALEAKDKYTHGHSIRVSEYALLIGRALKLSDEELIHLEVGALLHDIGKIGTPEHILTKPDRLTKEEFEIMKEHPVKSAEILSHIELLKEVVPIVKYHQERMDGLGYPDGLKGKQIPLLARAVLIADAFDAMTSDRPYRKALPENTAYEELIRCSGDQFDEELVKIFIAEHKKKKHLPSESHFFIKKPKRKAVGE